MIEERSNSTSNNEKSNSVFVAHVLNKMCYFKTTMVFL